MAYEWNAFLDTSADEASEEGGQLPQRVYARVESIELDAELRPTWIRLDGVDADWFDEQAGEHIAPESYFRRIPLAAIEFDPKALAFYPILESLGAVKVNLEATLTGNPHLWIQLELQVPGGFECALYRNLRGEPRFVNASPSVPALHKVVALRKTFDLANYFTPASSAAIRGVLKSIGSFDGVVVYDVGQGSSAGIVDSSGRPVLYADVGGGVTTNKHTFPAALRDFCSCTKAPIVLSHWDWDHWSSAGLKQNRWLRTHTWIAPMQRSVGPSHLSFAQSIVSNGGTLLLWARGKQPAINAGRLTLERCVRAGRNDSGIALIVDGPSSTDPMLFPGDARYTSIPGGLNSYDSVVVPHHGAAMTTHQTPVSPRKAHSRAVYSFGPGNKFSTRKGTISHPATVTRRDHHQNGWDDQTITKISPGSVRHTADRALTPNLGHVHVAWSSLKSIPQTHCPKGFSCDLSATQM